MGIVFDIQKFSVHDGPGIRTSVFLKGCNLSCIWCHNPESIKSKPQLAFESSLCIGCRECEARCETRPMISRMAPTGSILPAVPRAEAV